MPPEGMKGLPSTDRRLADEVVDVTRCELGSSVVGAYLHGSAVLGGLRATSDLDVLVVVDRPTSDDERRRIVDGLLVISGRRAHRGPARPVELTIVRADQLRPWRGSPIVDLLYGEWLRDEFERGAIPDPAPMADLGPEITLALQGDTSLFGAPPAEVLDPVPAGEIRRAVAAGVPSLLDDLASDTRNVLLTLARIWATVSTDEIDSKDASAAWALERLPGPHRGSLARAREMYLEGWDEGDWGDRLPAAEAAAAWLAGAIDRALIARRSETAARA